MKTKQRFSILQNKKKIKITEQATRRSVALTSLAHVRSESDSCRFQSYETESRKTGKSSAEKWSGSSYQITDLFSDSHLTILIPLQRGETRLVSHTHAENSSQKEDKTSNMCVRVHALEIDLNYIFNCKCSRGHKQSFRFRLQITSKRDFVVFNVSTQSTK